MSQAWSGRKVAEARAYIGARLPMLCQDGCGEMVKPGQRFVVAHIVPRWERPDLTFEPSNWSASHKACSDASGKKHADAAIKAKALIEAGSSLTEGPES